MSTISFSGLATGLDTASILQQLVDLKRAPVRRLQSDRKGFEAQIAALATLKTKLNALQTAAAKLDTATEFSTVRGSSSLATGLTVSASGSAAPGRYEVVVKTLATAQKLQSQGYDSKLDSVGSGTLSMTVNGVAKELTLVGDTTLESLAALINDNVDGVSATVINTGGATGAYRLAINGTAAGTANAFALDLSGLSGGIPLAMTTYSEAADATLTVDNIDVTATSNNPSDIISGITLNLLAADPLQPITVTVERDTAAITAKVAEVASAYNDLFSFIQAQSVVGGTLRENPTLRGVASRIENLFTTSLDGGLGTTTLFSQVGITRGEGRQIEFDEAKFADALAANYGAVRDFFINRDGNVGKSYLIDQAVSNMTNSTEGLFKISTDNLNARIKNADGRITRYERSIESYQLTMQRRFTAMEQMVAQLQSQSNSLGSIVSNR